MTVLLLHLQIPVVNGLNYYNNILFFVIVLILFVYICVCVCVFLTIHKKHFQPQKVLVMLKLYLFIFDRNYSMEESSGIQPMSVDCRYNLAQSVISGKLNRGSFDNIVT